MRIGGVSKIVDFEVGSVDVEIVGYGSDISLYVCKRSGYVAWNSVGGDNEAPRLD